MRNLGVRVERADVRWVGARRKKSTQVFELILLFTSVDGLFCLGTRETITTSTVVGVKTGGSRVGGPELCI